MEFIDIIDVKNHSPPICVGGRVSWPMNEIDVRTVRFDRHGRELGVVTSERQREPKCRIKQNRRRHVGGCERDGINRSNTRHRFLFSSGEKDVCT